MPRDLSRGAGMSERPSALGASLLNQYNVLDRVLLRGALASLRDANFQEGVPMDAQQELEERMARELDGISPRREAFDRVFLGLASRGARGFARHWLLIANLANALIVAGAVLVPLVMAAGLTGLGSALFIAYHTLCEQIPSHSYFLLGYQLAMDQRMMAIYGSSLLAGILFALLRGRVRPLPWRSYFLLILPMAVDGFTQMFGWRESNWQLRTVTGTLFGAATVWLMYPYLDRVLRPRGEGIRGR